MALIAAGGLIAWRVLLTIGATGEYLAVVRPVAMGEAITEAHLTTVRITVDPALKPIPADQPDQAVGRHAAVGLVPGTLLAADQLTEQAYPGPGQQLVGISLAQNRLPHERLAPGASVLLVITTDDNGTQQQPAAGPPVNIPATVTDVADGSKDGTMLVNVAVADRDGPLVAARAAAGRIAVVLIPGD
ncbi:SAF domain-containing protein [Micromonospora sp. NPDC049900]|uniref:SAF domain-containing protein n=1 Tax=Micromonospora sp. NPDC049900 TaxID=3364275 RepID=UPI0037A5CDB7